MDFNFQENTQAVAIIVAAVSAACAYLFDRMRERSKQQRENKIKAYEALILTTATYIRTADEAKKAAALEKFSEATATFCVWADKNVLVALSEYMRDSTHKTDVAKRTDVVLLRKDFAKLVVAIREDIGVEPAVSDAVGTIMWGDEWDKVPLPEPK